MESYRKSNRLFIFFLYLTLFSISGILFFCFTYLFFTDSGTVFVHLSVLNRILHNLDFFWFQAIIFLMPFILIKVFSINGLNIFLKLLIAYFLSIFPVFLLKNLLLFLFPDIFIFLNNIMFLIVFSILFLIVLILFTSLKKGFQDIFEILENEINFSNKEDYIKWAGGIAGNFPQRISKPIWYIRFASTLAIAILIPIFITVVKNDSSKWLLSFYLILFASGSFGNYLILYQADSMLKWKLSGFEVDSDIQERWNFLIIFFMTASLLISFIIPWNFRIFNTGILKNFLNKILSAFAISPGNNPIVDKPENQSSAFNNIQLISQEDLSKIIGFVWDFILISAAVYIVLGIIGGLLYIKYKNKNRSGLIRFLINCFLSLRKILSFFLELLFFIGIFSVKKLDNKAGNRKLEKHFYSFFNEYKVQSKEKLEEIQSIIKDFVRLIEAAGRLITPYYFHYGPLEYIERLIKFLPDLEKELLLVASVFNESRYSLHLLGEEKKKNYKKIINLILGGLSKS